ncbi:cytochrome-c peroxidase [Ruegeria jejuensis]|uniref:cytochrome-c peroxidase n=1 Tax=Ruegeria jejuensis TaxID=3233338 RepID=UPI00355BD0A2
MSIYKTCKLATAPGSIGSLTAATLTGYIAVAGTSLALVLLLAPGSTRAENLMRAQWPDSLRDSDFLFEGAPDEALVELGRNLFFDPILSGNRNISCGTCHDPARGSGDGVALSIGEGGTGFGPERRTKDGITERIPRNAQALWNIGAKEYLSMFHDGRVEPDPAHTFQSGFWTPAREHLPQGLDNLLAAQAMFPVLSASEMAGQKGENPVATAVAEDRVTDAWDLLAARLQATPKYQDLARAAFPDLDAITMVAAANALAAFQSRAFRSDNSPFDAFLRGDLTALSEDARAGADLFYDKAKCAACHMGKLLTDHEFHAIAVPQIGPGKGHGEDKSLWRASGFARATEDEGRYRVSFDPTDLFAFRTPSLRNVTLTGPWGHDGVFADLEMMVRHHLDSVASLEAYDADATELPVIDQFIEQTGNGSSLIFRPVNPKRRTAFDLRDTWVQKSDALRGRIAQANTLAPVTLSDREVARIMAFLEALTDPSAKDRSDLIPRSVPSGLTPQPTPKLPDG